MCGWCDWNCVRQLAEAENLMDREEPHILISSPLAGEEKCARCAALSRRGQIASVVDDASQVTRLSDMAGAPSLDLAIDVDVGQARTGVVGPNKAMGLAKQIAALPNLRCAGIQGYASHVQHIVTIEERLQAARRPPSGCAKSCPL
ncbi:MAG: D-threonine aldolase [Bradyrhizobium sp.]|jgi:D-serine deaminase-like pyridoxal phosphate-dependent protein|nr:D-threonine aldolase [Bradyrhizobium sp.]